MPTFRTSESSARGRSSISRAPTSSVTLRGNEWCAASARKRATYSVSPKTRRVVESRNVVFIETPPCLFPPSRRLSPTQGLDALTFEVYDNSLVCARNGACTRAGTGGTANNRHRHRRLRHGSLYYRRRYSQSKIFVCSYRLSGILEEPHSFGRSLPEGHGSTSTQAGIFKTRISRQFGRCAPTRRHVQHRKRLRHHQYARNLFDGGEKGGKTPTPLRRL